VEWESEFDDAVDKPFVDNADPLRRGGLQPDLTQPAIDVQGIEIMLNIQPDCTHTKLFGRDTTLFLYPKK
jgi:hypothetical protein